MLDYVSNLQQRIKVSTLTEMRQCEKRQARIASIFFEYQSFADAKRAEDDGKYFRFLENTVRAIAQTRDISKNQGVNIQWDEARNCVMTLEWLDRKALEFRKTHGEIRSDVCKVASHKSWIRGVFDRGEGRFLPKIPLPPIEFYTPIPPPDMTVAQIKAAAIKDLEKREMITREFPNNPSVLKTASLGLILESVSAAYPVRYGRRPWRRRDWRYEEE